MTRPSPAQPGRPLPTMIEMWRQEESWSPAQPTADIGKLSGFITFINFPNSHEWSRPGGRCTSGAMWGLTVKLGVASCHCKVGTHWVNFPHNSTPCYRTNQMPLLFLFQHIWYLSLIKVANILSAGQCHGSNAQSFAQNLMFVWGSTFVSPLYWRKR